jgi:hypothetical protein
VLFKSCLRIVFQITIIAVGETTNGGIFRCRCFHRQLSALNEISKINFEQALKNAEQLLMQLMDSKLLIHHSTLSILSTVK